MNNTPVNANDLLIKEIVKLANEKTHPRQSAFKALLRTWTLAEPFDYDSFYIKNKTTKSKSEKEYVKLKAQCEVEGVSVDSKFTTTELGQGKTGWMDVAVENRNSIASKELFAVLLDRGIELPCHACRALGLPESADVQLAEAAKKKTSVLPKPVLVSDDEESSVLASFDPDAQVSESPLPLGLLLEQTPPKSVSGTPLVQTPAGDELTPVSAAIRGAEEHFAEFRTGPNTPMTPIVTKEENNRLVMDDLLDLQADDPSNVEPAEWLGILSRWKPLNTVNYGAKTLSTDHANTYFAELSDTNADAAICGYLGNDPADWRYPGAMAHRSQARCEIFNDMTMNGNVMTRQAFVSLGYTREDFDLEPLNLHPFTFACEILNNQKEWVPVLIELIKLFELDETQVNKINAKAADLLKATDSAKAPELAAALQELCHDLDARATAMVVEKTKTTSQPTHEQTLAEIEQFLNNPPVQLSPQLFELREITFDTVLANVDGLFAQATAEANELTARDAAVGSTSMEVEEVSVTVKQQPAFVSTAPEIIRDAIKDAKEGMKESLEASELGQTASAISQRLEEAKANYKAAVEGTKERVEESAVGQTVMAVTAATSEKVEQVKDAAAELKKDLQESTVGQTASAVTAATSEKVEQVKDAATELKKELQESKAGQTVTAVTAATSEKVDELKDAATDAKKRLEESKAGQTLKDAGKKVTDLKEKATKAVAGAVATALKPAEEKAPENPASAKKPGKSTEPNTSTPSKQTLRQKWDNWDPLHRKKPATETTAPVVAEAPKEQAPKDEPEKVVAEAPKDQAPKDEPEKVVAEAPKDQAPKDEPEKVVAEAPKDQAPKDEPEKVVAEAPKDQAPKDEHEKVVAEAPKDQAPKDEPEKVVAEAPKDQAPKDVPANVVAASSTKTAEITEEDLGSLLRDLSTTPPKHAPPALPKDQPKQEAVKMAAVERTSPWAAPKVNTVTSPKQPVTGAVKKPVSPMSVAPKSSTTAILSKDKDEVPMNELRSSPVKKPGHPPIQAAKEGGASLNQRVGVLEEQTLVLEQQITRVQGKPQKDDPTMEKVDLGLTSGNSQAVTISRPEAKVALRQYITLNASSASKSEKEAQLSVMSQALKTHPQLFVEIANDADLSPKELMLWIEMNKKSLVFYLGTADAEPTPRLLAMLHVLKPSSMNTAHTKPTCATFCGYQTSKDMRAEYTTFKTAYEEATRARRPKVERLNTFLATSPNAALWLECIYQVNQLADHKGRFAEIWTCDAVRFATTQEANGHVSFKVKPAVLKSWTHNPATYSKLFFSPLRAHPDMNKDLAAYQGFMAELKDYAGSEHKVGGKLRNLFRGHWNRHFAPAVREFLRQEIARVAVATQDGQPTNQTLNFIEHSFKQFMLAKNLATNDNGVFRLNTHLEEAPNAEESKSSLRSRMRFSVTQGREAFDLPEPAVVPAEAAQVIPKGW